MSTLVSYLASVVMALFSSSNALPTTVSEAFHTEKCKARTIICNQLTSQDTIAFLYQTKQVRQVPKQTNCKASKNILQSLM